MGITGSIITAAAAIGSAIHSSQQQKKAQKAAEAQAAREAAAAREAQLAESIKQSEAVADQKVIDSSTSEQNAATTKKRRFGLHNTVNRRSSFAGLTGKTTLG